MARPRRTKAVVTRLTLHKEVKTKVVFKHSHPPVGNTFAEAPVHMLYLDKDYWQLDLQGATEIEMRLTGLLKE